MKKLTLMIALTIFGISGYSQEFQFTMGDQVPGQIKDGRGYEDFLSGTIKVVDKNNQVYTFVKADFELVAADGKKLQYTLLRPAFHQTQSAAIIQADDEGTAYFFRNVTVTDASGKQYTLAEVKYVFPSFAK